MERNAQIRLAHQLATKALKTLGALALSKGHSPEVDVVTNINSDYVYMQFYTFSHGAYDDNGQIKYCINGSFYASEYSTRKDALAAYAKYVEQMEEKINSLPDIRKK